MSDKKNKTANPTKKTVTPPAATGAATVNACTVETGTTQNDANAGAGSQELDAVGAAGTEGANTPNTGTGSQEPGAKGETEHPNPGRAASDAAEGAGTEPTEKAGDTKQTAEPKVSDAVVKIGKNLLKSNPAMSVVYMTTDGRGFYEKNDADNHARTLKNKAVTPVKK